MIVNIDGVDIDDPQYLLVDTISYEGIMTILDQVGGAILFPTYVQDYSNRDKKTWVVIPRMDLVIFKLKYGNKIHRRFTRSEFKGGERQIEEAGTFRMVSGSEGLFTKLALTEPDIWKWGEVIRREYGTWAQGSGRVVRRDFRS